MEDSLRVSGSGEAGAGYGTVRSASRDYSTLGILEDLTRKGRPGLAAACSWSCPPGEEMFGPSVVCTVTLFLSVLRQDYEFPFISAQRVTVCCGAL